MDVLARPPSGVAGIHYVSFRPGHGYGDAAAAYLSGLRHAGVPLTWTPMVWGGTAAWGPDRLESPFWGRSLAGEEHGDLCNLPMDYDAMVLHLPPWYYEPWLAYRRPEASVAGMMAWEMDAAPAGWQPILDALDVVIVPSEFNRRVLADRTTAPVEVVPHIARPVRPVAGGDYGQITERDFVFYTIGEWSARRAVGDTLRAFLDAFTGDDDVALVIKTGVYDHQAVAAFRRDRSQRAGAYGDMVWTTVARIIGARPNPPKVHLISEVVPQALVDQLHTRGDCYVSLSRGEGWGLPSFDAALFANPVIVTGWGGALEYLPADWPLLVDYELVPTSADAPDDAVELTADMRWARADRAHAAALMREVYENRGRAADLAGDLRPRLAADYEPERVTDRLLAVLAGAARRPSVEKAAGPQHRRDARARPRPPARLSYNKVCNVEDFAHDDLRPTIREVFGHERQRFGDGFPAGREYRKYWEVAMAVRTLRDHGLLDGTRELLGVGAGNEPTLFYLTRFARRVFATDLYLAGDSGWSEADASMLADAGRHWPFAWDPRRLVVQHMDGRDLRYEDESFDAVFSSSSIEHFGSWADARRSASEMFRVLKPGGILTLSTELCVEGPTTRWDCGGNTLLMDAEMIDEVIVGSHDWEWLSPLDLHLSDATLATEQDHGAALDHQNCQVAAHGGYFTHRIEHLRYPHIVMSWQGYSWTSVHLALRRRA